MEKFRVSTSTATHKILQEIAFNNGWAWLSTGKTIESYKDASIIFNPDGKTMTRGRTATGLGLEEGIQRLLDLPPQPFPDHEIIYHDNGNIKVGCQSVSFDDLEAIYKHAHDLKEGM